MDSRSEGSLFIVHPTEGTSRHTRNDKERPHVPDKCTLGPNGKSFQDTDMPVAIGAMTTYPDNGFDLKIHVFYSKSFADRFGPDPLTKYVGI